MASLERKPNAPTPLERLQQTLNHLEPTPQRQHIQSKQQLSIVHGPTDSPLWDMTLGELLEYQCLQHRNDECLVVSWTGTRWTYGQLYEESQRVARGLIARGVRLGDRIGVMAGNCEQYVSLFFAAASVGAILIVINNNYTLTELTYALEHTGKFTDSFFKLYFPLLFPFWLTRSEPGISNRLQNPLHCSQNRTTFTGGTSGAIAFTEHIQKSSASATYHNYTGSISRSEDLRGCCSRGFGGIPSPAPPTVEFGQSP